MKCSTASWFRVYMGIILGMIPHDPLDGLRKRVGAHPRERGRPPVRKHAALPKGSLTSEQTGPALHHKDGQQSTEAEDREIRWKSGRIVPSNWRAISVPSKAPTTVE